MNPSESLDDLLPSIWSLLERGASDRREPFHCPVLATAGAGAFGARTVILRKVYRDERALLAHSDRRATKIEQILASPRVVWVFYDARKKVQVRAEGAATVHVDDELAQRQWEASMVWSRRGYASLPPGTPLESSGSGLPAALVEGEPSLAEAELGRPHFAVVRCVVERFDWLLLDARGHRRAIFTWDAGGGLASSWVVP